MSTVQTNRVQHSSGTGNNIILSADGDTQVNSLNGSALGGFRNQIINGDFRVWQRGTPVTVPAAGIGYGPDRWRSTASGTTITRGTGLGKEHPSTFGARVNSSGGGGCSIGQAVELPQAGHFGPFTPGSTWTVSAYFEDPATASLNILFATGAEGPGDNWTAGEVTTLDTINGKTRVAQTFTVPATMDSARTSCLVVLADSVNNRLFCQAQLEPGPVATPFEHRPIATELALCQRYYTAIDGSFVGFSYQTDAQTGRIAECTFPVTMRATPTVTTSSQVNWATINSTIISIDRVKFEGGSANTAQTTYVTDVKANAEL